jgi:hypothetical protein
MELAGMMAIVGLGLRRVVAAIAIAIVLASCGGGEDEHDVQTPSANCAARPAACA